MGFLAHEAAPRTIGSTYLFTTSGPDFQIALPLLLIVPMMALPFPIMTWQRWKRRRPRGFEIDLSHQPGQA